MGTLLTRPILMSAAAVVLVGASPLETGELEPLKRAAGVYWSTKLGLAEVSLASSAPSGVVLGVEASGEWASFAASASRLVPASVVGASDAGASDEAVSATPASAGVAAPDDEQAESPSASMATRTCFIIRTTV